VSSIRALSSYVNMRAFIFITCALLWGHPSYATDTIFCQYGKYADEDGVHSVSGKFELTFIIDAENKKAYIVGNQGSDDVALIPSRAGMMSFVEVTDAGNVMSTAIDADLKSVHSRNSIIFGKLAASQYYGECAIK